MPKKCLPYEVVSVNTPLNIDQALGTPFIMSLGGFIYRFPSWVNLSFSWPVCSDFSKTIKYY